MTHQPLDLQSAKERKSNSNSASPPIVTGPGDAVLLAAEWTFRQIYWRSPALRAWIKRRRTSKVPRPQVADRQQLLDYLSQIGVTPGALVMAHTSVSGLSLDANVPALPGLGQSLQTAQALVAALLELLGDTGTLVMPTHPVYKPRAQAEPETALPLVYNPRTTPCGVGLANELFWRQAGTLRSLYPHNTLAAHGPLASALLNEDDIEDKSLPHGVNSGYHRFCQQNGLLISIGVPLANCFTLVHAAEEARDAQWPVQNFFEERNYILRLNGEDRPLTIRKTRTEFMMFSLCIRKLRRDLVRAGVLHEGQVGSIRVDWAHSGEIFQFITDRNRKSTYPYFGTSLVARKDQRHAA